MRWGGQFSRGFRATESPSARARSSAASSRHCCGVRLNGPASVRRSLSGGMVTTKRTITAPRLFKLPVSKLSTGQTSATSLPTYDGFFKAASLKNGGLIVGQGSGRSR